MENSAVKNDHICKITSKAKINGKTKHLDFSTASIICPLFGSYPQFDQKDSNTKLLLGS